MPHPVRAIWLGFFGTALLYLIATITIALPADPGLAQPAGFLYSLRIHSTYPPLPASLPSGSASLQTPTFLHG